MPGFHLIQDLAVILVVAGVAGWICQRAGLSVVVGFLVAGMLIGPHTPPFALVTEVERVETLAQLGLVFLMFSIGLQLSLRKLRRLGVGLLVIPQKPWDVVKQDFAIYTETYQKVNGVVPAAPAFTQPSWIVHAWMLRMSWVFETRLNAPFTGFVTGDVAGTDAERFLEESGCRWLAKPFRLADLLRTVRDTLA